MLVLFTVLLIVTASINAFEIEPDSRLSIERNFLFKCCPEGKYVGKRKNCVRYNKTLSFSTIKVYDEEMKDTGKSLEDVFNLQPSKFKDISFKIDALDVTLLDFNIYVTEVSIFILKMHELFQCN